MVIAIMLTLTAMFTTERQGVPRVAYITYLDVWMVGKTSIKLLLDILLLLYSNVSSGMKYPSTVLLF